MPTNEDDTKDIRDRRLNNIYKSALALFALSKGGYEASRYLDTISDEIDALENDQ